MAMINKRQAKRELQMAMYAGVKRYISQRPACLPDPELSQDISSPNAFQVKSSGVIFDIIIKERTS